MVHATSRKLNHMQIWVEFHIIADMVVNFRHVMTRNPHLHILGMPVIKHIHLLLIDITLSLVSMTLLLTSLPIEHVNIRGISDITIMK